MYSSWRDYQCKSNIKLLNDDGNNLLAFGPELQIKIMEWATLTFKYSTMIRVTYIYTFHKKPNLTQSKMKLGKKNLTVMQVYDRIIEMNEASAT